jgi:hypothetical protein
LQEKPRFGGGFRRKMTMSLVLAVGALAGPPGRAAPSPAVPGAPAPAAPPAPPPASSFARDVAPILNHWCVSCHGDKEAEAGLRLDSYAAALQGGEDGPVIVPGDPAASQLLSQIERRTRPAMPPRRRLPRDPVATIRTWIVTGAAP